MTTATTSKRQLKRLSLLQPALSNSTATTAVNGPTDAPDSAFVETFSPGHFTGEKTSSSTSHTTNNPAGSGASSSSRRWSTINYSSSLEEHHSPSSSSSPVIQKQVASPSSSSSSPLAGSQNAEEDVSAAAPPTRERAALTLVEKHADLLRFIAQKESKCLELRSQLAAHEAELLELKRKWERIVSKGFSGGAIPNSPALGSKNHGTFDASDASPQTAAVLNGIRESMQGVGRFIAGLSVDAAAVSSSNRDLEGNGEAAPSSTTFSSGQRKSKMSRTDRESNSSVSTSYTDFSSRLSQSSMSSFDDVLPDENTNHDNAEESKSESSPVLPSELVSAKCTPQRRSNSIRRRKDLSISQASITSLPGPTSTAIDAPSTPPVTDASSQSQSRPNHRRTATMASASLPPPSSIPGLGTFATGNISPLPLPAFSSWVDTVGKSVGKKFEQIQGGRVHKRASTLLSEASSSLFAVLAPPSPSPSSPASSSTERAQARKIGSKARKLIPTPPTSAKSTASQNSTGSLIDDIFEDELGPAGSTFSALIPDNAATTSSASSSSTQPLTERKCFDDDEWNW